MSDCEVRAFRVRIIWRSQNVDSDGRRRKGTELRIGLAESCESHKEKSLTMQLARPGTSGLLYPELPQLPHTIARRDAAV